MIAVLKISYYLLWAFNIGLVVKHKTSRMLSIFTWILLFVIFTSNSGLFGDAYKYKNDYELNAYGNSWLELGNELLKCICKSIGIRSYNQYLVVLFILASVLMYFGMRKMQGDFHALFAVSMSFIFPALTVAIRFFISIAIVVFSLNYLFEGKKVKYLLCLLIAVSFHSSAIFYLIYLIVVFFDETCDTKKLRYFIICIFGILTASSVMYVLIVRKLPFVEQLSSIITYFKPNAIAKVEYYFGSITHFGILIIISIYVVSMLLSKSMKKCACSNGLSNKLVSITDRGYYINCISVVLIPLTMINLVFFRLFIFETMVNVIVYSRIKMIEKEVAIGRIRIDRRLVLFLVLIITWMIPALFRINSISITSMFDALCFAN